MGALRARPPSRCSCFRSACARHTPYRPAVVVAPTVRTPPAALVDPESTSQTGGDRAVRVLLKLPTAVGGRVFPSRAVRHGTDLAAHFLTSERSRRSRLGLCRLVASGTYTPARIRSCLQYAPLIARQPRGSGALHVSRRNGTKICNVSGIHSLTDRVDRASRSAVNSKITYSND